MAMFQEYTRRETKARKAHICAECKTPIEKGTVYIRNGQKLGHEFSTVARHSDCLNVADRFSGMLMTHQGFRMFLVAGISRNPNIWPTIRDSICDEFPMVIERMAKAGLS